MNTKRLRALQIIRDSTVKGYCQSAMLAYEKSLERKRLKLKYAWQLMFIVNYRPSQKTNFMADCSQMVCMVAEVASGKSHAQTELQRFSSCFGYEA